MYVIGSKAGGLWGGGGLMLCSWCVSVREGNLSHTVHSGKSGRRRTLDFIRMAEGSERVESRPPNRLPKRMAEPLVPVAPSWRCSRRRIVTGSPNLSSMESTLILRGVAKATEKLGPGYRPVAEGPGNCGPHHVASGPLTHAVTTAGRPPVRL
jgi:hypothetical protein